LEGSLVGGKFQEPPQEVDRQHQPTSIILILSQDAKTK